MTFQTATLTGTYQELDGTPASGFYEIKPNSPIVDSTGNVIRSGYQKGRLDSSGHFSVVLPATDDATLEPALNRQYTIIVKPDHSHSSVPVLTGITLAGGTTSDTADLTTGIVAAAVYSAFFSEQNLADLHTADSTNASAITAEASSRAQGDAASVTTAASYTDTAISNLKGGVDPAWDTLQEIKAFVQADESTATALAASVAGKRTRFNTIATTKTASYTAAAWDSATFDTTAAAISQALPGSPTAGDEVEVFLAYNTTGNLLTVTGTGGPFTLNPGHGVTYRWNGAAWVERQDRKTKGSLDNAYSPLSDTFALRRLDTEGINAARRYSGQSAIDYADATVFTYDWSSIPTSSVANSFQVSGNRLYDDGVSPGGNQFSYVPLPRQIAVGEKFHFSIPIHIASLTSGPYVFFGVDLSAYTDATSNGQNFAVMGITGTGAIQTVVGTAVSSQITAIAQRNAATPAGEYMATIDGDETTVSIFVRNVADNTRQYGWSFPVAGFTTLGKTIGRIVVAVLDSRGLTGENIGPITGVLSSQQPSRTKTVASIAAEGIAHRDVYKIAATSGDIWRYQLPANYDPRRPAPIAFHLNQTGSSTLLQNKPWESTDEQPLTKALGDAGYIVAVAQDGFTVGSNNDRYANDVSLANWLAFYQYLRSHYSTGAVALYGPSGAGLTAMNLIARRTIPNIAAFYGICPAVDLGYSYNVVAGSIPAAVNTAYGIDGSHPYATQTAGHDPALFTGRELRGVPMRFSMVNDDTTAPVSVSNPFLAKVALYAPEASSRITATGGHLASAAWSASDLMTFFNTYIP